MKFLDGYSCIVKDICYYLDKELFNQKGISITERINDKKKSPETAKKIVMIENNQTAQFKTLIEHELGIKISSSILKYSGLQFTANELYRKMKEVI